MDINSVNSEDLLSRKLIFIDLETTGFSPQKHEILEIGAIKVEHKHPFNIIEEFCFKVKPEKLEFADSGALKVVKFNEREWEGALDLSEVLKKLETFGKEGIMVGYNVSFDWAFLDRAYFNFGKSDPFYYHRLDVMAMVYQFFTGEDLRAGARKSLYNRFAKTPGFETGDEGEERFQDSAALSSEALESLKYKKTTDSQSAEAYKSKKIKRYSLSEVCKYFEIKRDIEHRALDDARATYFVFKKLFGVKQNVIAKPQSG